MGRERRERLGAVVQTRRLILDERRAVLAVEVHRDLALLERVVGRELLAESGGERLQLLVADLVDERLLERHQLLPGSVGSDRRRAVRVQPRRTRGRTPVGGRVLVVAHQRVEAERLDRAVGVVGGELERHVLELFERLRGSTEAGSGQQVGVVVQAVVVGEHREGAARALELRVAPHGGAELAHVDLVPLDERAEIAEGAAGAEAAHDVRRVGQPDVDRGSRRDGLLQLVVVLAGVHVDRHAGIGLLEVVDDGLDRLRLAIGEEVPERDGAAELDRGGRGDRGGGAGGTAGENDRRRDECRDDGGPTADRNAIHGGSFLGMRNVCVCVRRC